MSPEKTALKLGEIVDEIAEARRFVDVGWMATYKLEEHEREALSELLILVATKLCAVIGSLETIIERQVA